MNPKYQDRLLGASLEARDSATLAESARDILNPATLDTLLANAAAGLAFATEEVRYVRRELKSDPSLEPEEGRPGSANRLALALRRLLACPDLNCDSLDPLTHEAITYARGSL